MERTEAVRQGNHPIPHSWYRQSNPLPVMEHFYTLQGEGYWTGTPTYFIRLAGCDVGCHWCDVKESWEVSEDQYMTCDQLIQTVTATKAERVVITGGEPTIYDLQLLTSKFHQRNIKTHIETAGVHPLTGHWDWICFSPKKFLAPLEEFYDKAHELKVIIYNSHDFQWAESHAEKCHENILLYLQPEWSKRETMTPSIIRYIQENPHWKLSQQTHKYIGIP